MAMTNDPEDGGRARSTSVTGGHIAGGDPAAPVAPAAGGAAPAGVGGAAPAGAGAPVGAEPAGRVQGARGTRTSHTWVALVAGLFFLIVVLVFILQNLKSIRVHFFWATWTVPLAVDLLLAAVLGALVMFTVGSLRIVQLRRAARRVGAGRGKEPRRP